VTSNEKQRTVPADRERQRLLECIDRLPVIEREIYILAEMEQKPAWKIASEKNLSEPEVQQWLLQARAGLRKLFFES